MTSKVLSTQIGKNVLTYVDDIIVKSTKKENHIADLQETFANFRMASLKLNLEKCVFRVKKENFLRCLVSTKGIEANPSKIEAILRMEPPKTRKGAQRLRGRLASLKRFISRSAERNLPFFKVLKSVDVFQSTKGLRRSETISYTANNLDSTIRSSVATVCGCFPRCSQCSAGAREIRRTSKEESPNILHLRSTKSIKKKLHRTGEGTIRCADGLQKASTLFPVIPHHSTFIPTSQGHHKKQRSYRKTWKMGCKAE
jgi:hypothetical protein